MSLFKKHLTLIAITILALYSEISQAEFYYVSPDGAASWEQCTNIDTPCAATTAMQYAIAGDTVYFRGSIYNLGVCEDIFEHAKLEPENSGTADNPITFMAYKNENPIMNCTLESGKYRTRALGNNYNSYIIWDGFTVQANNGTKPGGIVVWGDYNRRTTGNIVRNCTINGGSDDIPAGWDSNVEGIRIDNASNTLIQNCKIYNFTHAESGRNTSAIKTYHDDHLTIEHCDLDNNVAGIFIKSDTDDSTFRYNFISNSVKKGIYLSTFMDVSSDRNKFHDNVIINSGGWGFYSADDPDDNHADDLEIYNNTFYSPNSIRAVLVSKGQRYKIYNNIIQGHSDNQLTTRTGATIQESDHNQFGSASRFRVKVRMYTGETNYTSLTEWKNSGELIGGGNPGSGSLNSDPLFVNISGNLNQLADFALANNSPSRGTGREGTDMGANISRVGSARLDLSAPKPPSMVEAK